jgi:hypothetical protein
MGRGPRWPSRAGGGRRSRQQLRRPVRIRSGPLAGARAPPWPVLVQPPTTTTARRSRRDRRTRGPEPSATERGSGIKPPCAFDCRGQRPAGRAGPNGQTRGVDSCTVLPYPTTSVQCKYDAPRGWARDPRAHARPIVRAARPIKGPAPVCTPTWPGSHQIARQRTAAPAGSACVRAYFARNEEATAALIGAVRVLNARPLHPHTPPPPLLPQGQDPMPHYYFGISSR